MRFLHTLVTDAGFRAVLLHGERSQEEREAAMADFRSGKAQVLVATDVAARGEWARVRWGRGGSLGGRAGRVKRALHASLSTPALQHPQACTSGGCPMS